MTEITGSTNSTIAFASELKSLKPIQDILNTHYTDVRDDALFNNPKVNIKKIYKQYQIQQFTPGTYAVYTLPFSMSPHWRTSKQVRYNAFPFNTNIFANKYDTNNILDNIQTYFKEAVYKRCITTDRPIACLLSGGLDSSLVAALVNEYHKMNHLPKLETYSIGMEGSEDLKYAQQVADSRPTHAEQTQQQQ